MYTQLSERMNVLYLSLMRYINSCLEKLSLSTKNRVVGAEGRIHPSNKIIVIRI